MGARKPRRNRVVVPARRLHRLAELIPWNRLFLGSLESILRLLKSLKIRAEVLSLANAPLECSRNCGEKNKFAKPKFFRFRICINIGEQNSSVKDPGCLLPGPGSEFFHPGSRVKKTPDPNPHRSISVFLSPKDVSKLSTNDLGCSFRIRILFSIPGPDPGSRGQKSTGSWIPDPDQHGSRIRISNTEE
jgi:hypothetical protein